MMNEQKRRQGRQVMVRAGYAFVCDECPTRRHCDGSCRPPATPTPTRPEETTMPTDTKAAGSEWQEDDYAWLAPVSPDGGQVAWRGMELDDDKPWVDQMGNTLTDAEMTKRGAVLLVRNEQPVPAPAAVEVREEWGEAEIRAAFDKHAGLDDWGVPAMYVGGLLDSLRGKYDEPQP